jgi:hypothetical protein
VGLRPVFVVTFLLGDTQEMQTVKTRTTKKINPKGVLFGFIKWMFWAISPKANSQQREPAADDVRI